ncbi:hypothetical protein EVAR_81522_1 [Eumeta japonica]|uniref:Uncharacterized protein n=1 Tax=Eumeta variegata TaxID=151549 RepID=A0A4C1W3K3_EUMVA|nr:hypothetical protein EVAR_81522_1 [Eumeta japonica]
MTPYAEGIQADLRKRVTRRRHLYVNPSRLLRLTTAPGVTAEDNIKFFRGFLVRGVDTPAPGAWQLIRFFIPLSHQGENLKKQKRSNLSLRVQRPTGEESQKKRGSSVHRRG